MTTITETAFERVCRVVADHTGRPVRGSGANRSAVCPAHDDNDPSLSITRAHDRVLINCQAGCDIDAILQEIGLTRGDLFDKPHERTDKTARPVLIATYEYTDPQGKVLFCKGRYQPKDFRVWRPKAGGGKDWGIGDAPRVLYRLPNIVQAISEGRTILLVEGEKDVHAAEKAGAVATCNFDGAAKAGNTPKWRPEYGNCLRGAHVVIVADNDEAGYAHARAARADLAAKAASVRVVRGLVDNPHADLADHLAAGHTLDELAPLDLDAPTEPPAHDGEEAEPDPVEALIGEMLDSADLDNIPAPEPVIRDVLFLDTIARVYGESGTFKSFITLDFAGCVGTGTPWHGHPVRQGLVVYIVAEGARGVRKRVRAWEQHHGRPMTGVKFLPRPVQSKSSEWDVLTAACERLQPTLIIVDTQARVTVGVEENSATEMGVFVDRVEKLRATCGACVLLVHHAGYNGGHGRGSTSVKGAMQTELSVSRRGKGARDTVVTLSTGKQKDDEELADVQFKLRIVELAGEADEEGRPVTSVVLEPAAPLGPEPGSVEDAVAKLDAMSAPAGWSRRKARTEASKRGVVLPRDEVLSEAIKRRRDRLLFGGSQSGSQPPSDSKIAEPLSMVPEPGTTTGGTTGQGIQEPPGTTGNHGTGGGWFPDSRRPRAGTSPRAAFCSGCGTPLDPVFVDSGSTRCAVCTAKADTCPACGFAADTQMHEINCLNGRPS